MGNFTLIQKLYIVNSKYSFMKFAASLYKQIVL